MKLELLAATDYSLLEGPRVDEQGRLYFSDGVGGGVYRRTADGNVETLIPKRRGVGGLALNQGGGVVASGRTLVYWNEKTRQSRDVFTDFVGRLNDLQPDQYGSIFVGSIDYDIFAPEKPPGPGFLYRVDPDGKFVQLWDGIKITNGMGFSPDFKLLYHNDSATPTTWVYDVRPDRTVSDRRVFARLSEGIPDGLAVDAEGGVLVAAARHGGVARFKTDGTLDWFLKAPVQHVTSLTFGGANLQDLYVVSATEGNEKASIFKTRVEIPGMPVPKANFQ